MKTLFSSMPCKSLLLFTLSLFGSWNGASLLHSERFYQTPSLVLDIKNGSSVDLADIPGLEIYSCFVWFFSMLLILEIISFSFALIRKRSDKIVRQSYTFFIKYYVNILVRYSLCYLLYMSIFFAACFVCNIYTSTKGSCLAETTSLTKSTERSLQEKIGEGVTGQLISPSSSSTLIKSIFLIETDSSDEEAVIAQMVISSDSNTVFALLCPQSVEDTSLLIFNATTKDSPSLIINFPLFAKDSSPLYIECSFPIALSSDEKTMVINTYYSLQIVDISDLKSPVRLGLISQVNTTYNCLSLSSNAQTIFVSIYFGIEDSGGYDVLEVIDISNATSPTVISSYNLPLSFGMNYMSLSFIISDDYKTLFFNNITNIEIVNITNLQSPQFIYSINSSDFDISYFDSIQIYRGYLYTQTESSLLIYNISDLTNPVAIANISFSEPYENYTHPSDYWAITDQLGFLTYGLYEDGMEQDDSPGLLRIVNISNNAALNTIRTINFTNFYDISEASLAESPDGRYIFFSGSNQLYIYDIALQSLIALQVPVTGYEINDMIVSSGCKTLFLVTNSQIWIVQLNFDMKARQALDLLDNQVGVIQQATPRVPICSKTNQLYIACLGYLETNLLIVDITNPTVEHLSPPISGDLNQMALSSDEKYLFVLTSQSETGMSQFAIYNFSTWQNLSSFPFVTQNGYYSTFVMTPDSNTVLILQNYQNFFILDVSNRTDIQFISNTSNTNLALYSATLSNDGKTAFLQGYLSLWIYDISAPLNPNLLTIYNHTNPPGLTYSDFMAIAHSLDGNKVFIITTPLSSSDECTLNIIDVSSLSSPRFITAIALPDICLFGQQPLVVPMISNEILFVPLNQSLAVIDVTVVESPIPLDYYFMAQPIVIVSPDYSTLIVNSWAEGNISLITLTPENILYSELNSFPLGQTNSITPGVFTRNPSKTYDIELSSHKFIDMSLSVLVDTYGTMTQKMRQTDEILPNWMAFDQNSGIITFSPNNGSQIGIYILSGTLSKQIPNTTFIGVGPINNTSDSFNLFFTLVISGYLDNQGYLTSTFDSTQPLLLPQQYINEELLIRQRLDRHLIQAFMQVYIAQSLTLTVPNSPSSPISIDTLSLEPLNIMITLEGNGNVASQPKFVTIGYSFTASFSQNNTVVSLVMSLFDANTALSELVLFLNGSQSCTANITIIDGLNPTLTQIVPDISQHFYINLQPIINVTYFQYQLAKISPKIGEQFVFQIDSSTFSDINNESLTLSIQMNDGSQVPEWLELKDLSIIGTFPEQLTGREIDLILTVSNQYQSTEIGFTLDAGISIEYAFQLIGTYGGALITVIGLLVYATTIYNILAKRYYRYSKEFKIRVGQEVNPKVLYPIYFGLKPLRESKLIMCELDKKIAQEIGKNSKAQIAAYFTSSNSDTCKIDRVKLTEVIEDTAAEIREKDKYKLRCYTPVLTPQKELINQLIINNYIMRLLDLDEAKPTKTVFNLIKPDIFSFVNLDKCLQDGICLFSVNITRLDSELQKRNIKTSNEVQSKHEDVSTLLEAPQSQPSENQTEHESLETELLPKVVSPQSQANADINMLIYVMEAYAFNQNIIDADILKIDVLAKERLVNIWPLAGIRRFLKLDLEPIYLIKKARLGYGIKYNIQENCLTFYGTASEDIKDITLVIQIVTRRGKILREIWVHGGDANAEVEREILPEQVL